MTDNSKTPPAKKTIQDPPEYAAAPGEAALKKAPKGSLSGGSGDWLGGPQNGAEAPASKDEERARGEGARNPQTGERYARNPQTGE
ncbi:hypothetical protein ELI38_01405 [Rhizobium leguminosarum]|jgi:hypothetical protein|nr:hypothetical protein ELI38_01405 [Rhizobium leguminosarum]TAV09206.1 hypothetical protein ELI37_01035 [Rhizobium leguminosarum]TAW50123.1 hypothetical protein ELI14_01410 [Rhizobium leguminosarum]TAX48995.1 hypothetical protein ELH99_01490 [Rhizobium leguminosarum]TAZ60023.1 hypothetical protein ELH75_01615 [Rhizobium leguminosarum]